MTDPLYREDPTFNPAEPTHSDDGHLMACCVNCIFWDKPANYLEYGWESCRRFPPVDPDKRNENVGTFPRTRFSDWCGEHEYRPEDLKALTEGRTIAQALKQQE